MAEIETTGLRSDGSRRARARSRLAPFPRSRFGRWGSWLLLALPFALIAVVTAPASKSQSGRNDQVLNSIADIDWSQGDPQWLGELYPPIPTLIALAIPSALGLALIGAAVSGVFLRRVLEIMVQRRVPLPTIVILLLALAVNPVFAYIAIENLPTILALSFFGLGMTDTVRFVRWGNTQAGFNAGVLFMLAALSDLSALLYIATLTVTVPFLAAERRHVKSARWANLLVLLFPTASALSAWVVLQLVFTGAPFGAASPDLLVKISERLAFLGSLFQTPGGQLLIAPVICSILIGLIVRSPGAALGSTLVFATLLGGYVFGLVSPTAVGSTFIVMMLLVIAFIPTARRPWAIAGVDIVGLVLVIIGWWTALERPLLMAWTTMVADTVLAIFGI